MLTIAIHSVDLLWSHDVDEHSLNSKIFITEITFFK